MYARRLTSLLRASLVLTVLRAIEPSQLGSQERLPAVFVHGLGQTGNSWNVLARDLESRHPIIPLQPTLGSSSFFEIQAANLRNYLDAQGMIAIAAISHSNGGLVVREYARSTATARINRHLSLGTPHRGAALAGHVASGNVWAWASQTIGYIVDPIAYYYLHDPNWRQLWLDHGSTYYFEYAAYTIVDLLNDPWLPQALAALGFLIGTSWEYPDVVHQMPPGSSFIARLNDPGVLAAEAQKIPIARVSISTQYPPELAPWSWFTDDFGAIQLELLRQDAMSLAWDAYWYYLNHRDWRLASNAYRWQNMFWALASIPGYWQLFHRHRAVGRKRRYSTVGIVGLPKRDALLSATVLRTVCRSRRPTRARSQSRSRCISTLGQ